MMTFIALVFLRPADAQNTDLLPGGIGQLVHAEGGYVGSKACASCHTNEFHAWAQSHHAFAMADATPQTVRGDFDNVTAMQAGSKARFFKRDGAFMVETEKRDGQPQTFTITSVFGVEPLQQYLVRFPDGRVQALPWAWDTRPKERGGQRWFHVYGDEPIPVSDSRHWTRGQQNWNYMCAECHSTHVTKNYDVVQDHFDTRFSEISVGCESCHGAGQGHIRWVEAGKPASALKGFAHQAAKRSPADWTIDPKTGNPRHGVARPQGDEVETCARCHARRSILSEEWKPGAPLEETHLPSFLSEGLFESDGTMRDEVFNDHSFKQSLMYQKGVVCSDCHEPHSAKLKAPGAQVCGQCHATEKFTSIQHTGHPPNQAPDCISCHMPARTYMVVDQRHDHSFRIPRPDLSVKTGVPNACNDCHNDQSASWAASAITQWHGPHRRGFQTWGDAFALARKNNPDARPLLLTLINDPKLPALVRATALDEGLRFPSREFVDAAIKSLNDPAPIVRIAAIRALVSLPPEERAKRLIPLLSDPVRTVRIEAASALSALPPNQIPPLALLPLEKAQAEREAALQLNADRPEARAGLAQLAAQKGHVAGAERELRDGLARHPDAVVLAVNLADLYRASGREQDAANLLATFLASNPDSAAARHALGLSLVRQKKHTEALAQFERAYRAEPDHPRYAYVYGVALQSIGRAEEGRHILENAIGKNEWNVDLNNALLADALRANDVGRAAVYARRLVALRPDDPSIARLSDVLNRP